MSETRFSGLELPPIPPGYRAVPVSWDEESLRVFASQGPAYGFVGAKIAEAADTLADAMGRLESAEQEVATTGEIVQTELTKGLYEMVFRETEELRRAICGHAAMICQLAANVRPPHFTIEPDESNTGTQA